MNSFIPYVVALREAIALDMLARKTVRIGFEEMESSGSVFRICNSKTKRLCTLRRSRFVEGRIASITATISGEMGLH